MDAATRAVSSGEDLYGLLGLESDATDGDIRHAYRRLARLHHPDVYPDETAAEAERFRRIAAAYEILGYERGRTSYDRALELERMATERTVRAGPVASHVAPRPTGAVSSRGRAASANPADHAPRVVRETPARRPVDEWDLVSMLGRVVAAAAVIVVVAVIALMVVSVNARDAEPPPPTIWCKTPDGWYDCWQATSPGGP